MQKQPVICFCLGVLIAFLLNLRPAIANEPLLKSIQSCLPRPAAGIDVQYRYSLADKIDDLTALTSSDRPFRYLLVRVQSSSMGSPFYSLIGLKQNRHCTNYSPNPTINLQLSQFMPQRLVKSFQRTIDSDRDVTWKIMLNEAQRKYPGRNVNELRQIGAFGLD